MIQTKLFSDLTLITPEGGADAPQLTRFTILENEPFSFQLAYTLVDDPEAEKNPEELHFFLRLDTDLPVSTYHVSCVPVMHSYSRINPRLPIGMYPDILLPKQTSPRLRKETIRNKPGYRYIEVGERQSLAAYNDSWRQLWLTVNEAQQPLTPGIHRLKLELFDISHNKVGENALELEVLPAQLPAQTLWYTNWFHNDCLADFYNLPLFSDAYYEVFENFLRTAVKNGMNMLLLPAFTPPLDTAIGQERMTVQLVQVEKTGETYRFDFAPMERYIHHARAAGIQAFEHSHLFTQWGAAHAPKIMATVDGHYGRLFGWDTDAAGEEYVTFLRAYIPAVREFLRGLGLEETTLFHLSDEPSDANFETYQNSCAGISDLLDGCIVGDALSDYKYYSSGLVQTPIARTNNAGDFVDRCDRLWIYYTGGECYDGLSNRLIQLPRERNRAMGWQLYWAKAKGFLHWGYNFYYGRLSHGLYDPALDPCCGFANAGTTYSVYPGREGKPLQSIHQKIFADALIDHRALQLLESLTDRQTCMGLIREYLGEPSFYNTPENPEQLLAFRLAVNEKIKTYL